MRGFLDCLEESRGTQLAMLECVAKELTRVDALLEAQAMEHSLRQSKGRRRRACPGARANCGFGIEAEGVSEGAACPVHVGAPAAPGGVKAGG
jgi:hypothetical protein